MNVFKFQKIKFIGESDFPFKNILQHASSIINFKSTRRPAQLNYSIELTVQHLPNPNTVSFTKRSCDCSK